MSTRYGFALHFSVWKGAWGPWKTAFGAARDGSRAQGIMCMNNTRQLTLAWIQYAQDNNDRLVYNQPSTATDTNNWAGNVMSWGADAQNTNQILLMNSKLGPYLGNTVNVFKCPADKIPCPLGPRVRSVSMNAFVGPQNAAGTPINGQWRQFLRLSDFPVPVPASERQQDIAWVAERTTMRN